ncbi:hypothetical protein M1L60_32515 [Actinoplanes sp. TRM 88003]|uniref:Uncharacterized protein n=1 Tax=Paractinoplanes aksuensis TaxID=2939490 RepID=A0ABT1DX04_9ACTN|nr:hypothetical protein [Actinoplanes aksuensis]MCO8275317.1 hypothetical protein [Actinoplanes aksuensis]
MPAPQQQPTPLEIDVTPPEAVVEFGSSDEPRRSRWSSSGLGRDLLADRRTVPLTAALAALAALVSLLSEWQVTTLDPGTLGGEGGERILPIGLDDLGTFGIGYVVGLFLLVPAVVLTLFGPPAGRRYARLAGLSVAGTHLGLLVATATAVGSQSYVIDPVYRIAVDESETTLAYGRGLWCAFAGVLLIMAALYLAGRHLPAATTAPSPEAAPIGEPELDPVWSWRRPSSAEADRSGDESLDLTVAPSQPFTSLNDDRDRPN